MSAARGAAPVTRALVVAASVAAVAAAVAGACGGRRDGVPPGVARVKPDSIIVKQGTVGARQQYEATYVYVDVENTSAQDRLVAAGGKLLAADGRVLGSLKDDQVLIPAGHTRTLVPVFDRVAPEATGARIEVTSARALGYEWPIQVAGVSTEREPTGLAVTARFVNTADRKARLVKIGATFYDAGGRILGRPFTFIDLEPRGTRPFRFAGPPEAERAVVFLGEAEY